mmetsp:Transcript_27940/g.82132  ORF Transcript_27940/g.82132 Transcript_27940/m.82132 type:complete len:363 (-) Transcript_27940:1177-2265(-)
MRRERERPNDSRSVVGGCRAFPRLRIIRRRRRRRYDSRSGERLPRRIGRRRRRAPQPRIAVSAVGRIGRGRGRGRNADDGRGRVIVGGEGRRGTAGSAVRAERGAERRIGEHDRGRAGADPTAARGGRFFGQRGWNRWRRRRVRLLERDGPRRGRRQAHRRRAPLGRGRLVRSTPPPPPSKLQGHGVLPPHLARGRIVAPRSMPVGGRLRRMQGRVRGGGGRAPRDRQPAGSIQGSGRIVHRRRREEGTDSESGRRVQFAHQVRMLLRRHRGTEFRLRRLGTLRSFGGGWDGLGRECDREAPSRPRSRQGSIVLPLGPHSAPAPPRHLPPGEHAQDRGTGSRRRIRIAQSESSRFSGVVLPR